MKNAYVRVSSEFGGFISEGAESELKNLESFCGGLGFSVSCVGGVKGGDAVPGGGSGGGAGVS